MSNTFSGLEIGRRALSYFRQGIETAGHNISNADVEGYSRQRVEASATTPFSSPGMNRDGQPGQVGTGVGVDSINSIRDAFLDSQYQQESIAGGFWEAVSSSMEYIEMFIGEPSDNGIAAILENVNQALQELQKRPDSSTTREAFVRELDNLSSMLNHTYSNLDEYRSSLNQEVELKVQEANDLIDRIASLNEQIKTIKAVGNNPNDLMDRRNLLVENLSTLADVSVSTQPETGAISVSLAGRLLVQNTETRHLLLVPQEGNQGYYDVQIEENEFLSSSEPNTATATIGRNAQEGIHQVEVSRIASETRWAVGDNTGSIGFDSMTEALGLEGSFSLHVGVDGVKRITPDVKDGILLNEPAPGERENYSIRLSAGTEEKVLNIAWDETGSEWTIDGSVGFGNELTIDELAAFLNSGESPVKASVSGNRISFYNTEGMLISLSDISGDLLSSKAGIDSRGEEVEIEVKENDSLQTVANKINSAYDFGSGDFEGPEDWLHATVEEASNGSFFLKLESNQVGESYRINVESGQNGSLTTAEQLGLVSTEGTASIITHSADALFKVDGMEYLSSTNSFSEARLITSYNGYGADTLQPVLDGISLNLKGPGSTDITVEKHVKGGFIEGLLQSRDNYVTKAIDFLNSFSKALSDQMNAIHYSGHGGGEKANTTGTALFEPLSSLSEAAAKIGVNGSLLSDSNLVAVAGDDGEGHSLGSGDGSKALELIQLYSEPVFNRDSSTIDEYYSSFVASTGSESRQAQVMNDNQQTMINQISNQRQSVSGVNVDEEMMDMIQFQQSYQAISRYITVLDEMLDKVINGMGLVGR